MTLIFSRRSSSVRLASSGREFLRPIRSERISGLAHRRMMVPFSRMTFRFSGCVRAPPPRDTIKGFSLCAISAMTSRSILRNAASPSCSKISLIDFPARSTMTLSVSTNGRPRRSARARPVRLLPLAMNPVKYKCFFILALHSFAHNRGKFFVCLVLGFFREPFLKAFESLVDEHSFAGHYLASLGFGHLQ